MCVFYILKNGGGAGGGLQSRTTVILRVFNIVYFWGSYIGYKAVL